MSERRTLEEVVQLEWDGFYRDKATPLKGWFFFKRCPHCQKRLKHLAADWYSPLGLSGILHYYSCRCSYEYACVEPRVGV